MRQGEQVRFSDLATKSRRDRAIFNARNLLEAFSPVSAPVGQPLGGKQYFALLDKHDRDPVEHSLWTENVEFALDRAGVEHENTARLRGCMAALCALRDAVKENPADTEAREFGMLIRDYLAECWHVPSVPDGIAERDHLARSVVRGMMRLEGPNG